MNILDNQPVLKRFNQSKVADSIANLPQQIAEAYQEAGKIKLPRFFKFKNIIFCGMGGSNLASAMVRDIYGAQIKLPMVLVRSYNLPAFAGKDSLVVISSYSGNTEEAVSCLNQAIKMKAKIICLTTGGKISAIAKKQRLPIYLMSKKFNPSRQPRYGIGSQLGALLAIFAKLKIIKLNKTATTESIEYLEILNKLFAPEIGLNKNLAKGLAIKFKDFAPMLVAGDFLSANARILANQINESAKTFAISFKLPELNHHLLEGLAGPKSVMSGIKFLFFNSNQYPAVISRRAMATETVLKKQGVQFIEYAVNGSDKLSLALEILLFGSWLSYYLAILNNQNPAVVPWVDYFKKILGAGK